MFRAKPRLMTIAVASILGVASLPALADNKVLGIFADIAGGDGNFAMGDFSSIGGGYENSTTGLESTIGGGQGNAASGQAATVAGGAVNKASADNATVSGGIQNKASGYASFVGGGKSNFATGDYSVAAGGLYNQANGPDAVSGGGWMNRADGQMSVVPGGYANQAEADFSFAAGTAAYVRSGTDSGTAGGDYGTFIWADNPVGPLGGSAPPIYSSSGPNQFLVRAGGGFALNTTPVNSNVAMTVASTAGNPGYASVFLHQGNSNNGILVSSGDATTGTNTQNNAAFYIDQYNGSRQTRLLSLGVNGSAQPVNAGGLVLNAQAYKPGGGSWAASSDARLKKNIQSIDHALDRLLALRGVTFEYAAPDEGMHPAGTFTGFIAQEVQPLFPEWIARDAQGYLTVGPQGFEALTVESLREIKNQADARIDELQAENAAMKERMIRLQKTQDTAIAELQKQLAMLVRESNKGDEDDRSAP